MKTLGHLETEKTHTFYTSKDGKRVPIRLMKTEFATKEEAQEYLNGTPNLVEDKDDKGNITLWKAMAQVEITGTFTISTNVDYDSIY